MEYYSQENIDRQEKSKNNPDKVYIPFNSGRQITGGDKSFGSGQPPSKKIELFSTVERGIVDGRIRIPTPDTGVVTPVGNVVPTSIGQLYVDTVLKLAFISVGPLNTDWTQI